MTCNSLVFEAKRGFIGSANGRQLSNMLKFVPEKSCRGCDECSLIRDILSGLERMGPMVVNSFLAMAATHIEVEAGKEYKMVTVNDRNSAPFPVNLIPINLQEREREERSFSV